MSRIIYPSGFDQQVVLLKNILSKHNAEGAASVLTTFLIQQNIVLTADVTAGADAQTHETNRLGLTKQSQNYSQLRDLKFDFVFAHFKSCLQFLKSFYKPNLKALGDWGAPIDTNGKITYPADVVMRITLFKTLKKMHDSFPVATSPLLPYLSQNNIDLAADDAYADSALDFHSKFQQYAKEAENETEQRDIVWQFANGHIHSIGNYLKKLYSDNPKTLGLWGFVVDNSPRTPKERISTVKPGDKVIVAGVVLGSTLTNISKVDIHIYAGKTTTGNPVIVHANEVFGITKGYSVITVSNPSGIETAQVKVLINP